MDQDDQTYESTAWVTSELKWPTQSSTTWADYNDQATGGHTGYPYNPQPYTTVVYPESVDIGEPPIPKDLLKCFVCGIEDVLIFCDACRDVIREARKQWAKDFLEEIEDALS